MIQQDLTVQDMSVAGVAAPVQFAPSYEYVPGPLGTSYLQSLATIQTTLNLVNPIQNTDPTQGATGTDYTNFYTALTNLTNLATNGVSDPSDPSVIYYMTPQMAQAYQNVTGAIQAAGIPLTPVGGTEAQEDAAIKSYTSTWASLSGYGLNQILTNASGVYTDSSTLQSMIELVYVKAGNDQLLNQLNSLQNALQANQNSLDVLTIIQNISNEVAVQPTGNFVFPPVTLADIPPAAAMALASQVGTNGLTVLHNGSTNNYPAFANYNVQYISDAIAAGGVPPTVNSNTLNPPFTYPELASLQSTIPYQNYFYPPYNSVTNPNPTMIISQPDPSQWSTPPTTSAESSQTQFATAISTAAAQSTGAFESLYQVAAQANFSQQNIYSTATAADVTSLANAKQTLLANITAVEALDVVPPNNRNTPNTLANFLNNVATSIPASLGDPSVPAQTQLNDLNTWIIDNQNVAVGTSAQSSLSGTNQGNITLAITSSQSLNDTQKQNVQQAMFIFQEYYQSSSTVLQSINDLITSMAKSIGQ
jgi:hypothetical protein